MNDSGQVMGVLAAIGFDLDMTLVDSRPVSERALIALASMYGRDLDVDELMAVYGLPISEWLPPQVDSELFRRLQSEHLSLALPVPGAEAAIDAARRATASVVVITAAPFEIADGMLKAAGLRVDRLHTEVWGQGKARRLREEACSIYVGDHTDDMLAARQAGAVAVGVNTGTTLPLGAEVSLSDLRTFPGWLADHAVRLLR